MLHPDIDCAPANIDDVACRIDVACALIDDHPEMASAITLVGLANCGETYLAVQRARRAWPVEILLHARRCSESIDVEVRAWPAPDVAPARPARGHVPPLVKGVASFFAALRRPARHLERSTR